MTIPEILTPRLCLRGHRRPDFPASAAMWADPVVTRFIGGRALTTEEAWARFLRYAGHWSILDFGYWVIEERATGEFVGETGFADLKRDIQPSIDNIPEIGWVLLPRFHGRGYATEAVRAALDWGRTHFPSPATVCLINPANLASVRVAEKCGFANPLATTYHNEPALIFTGDLSRPTVPSR